MPRRTLHRAVIAAVAVLLPATLASVPAAADCVRVAVTYTSASGSTTSVNRPCVVSTPWNETYDGDQKTSSTAAGYVRVQFGVPLP